MLRDRRTDMVILRAILILAIGLFVASTSLSGLKRGRYTTRFGLTVDRADRPLIFWLGVTFGLAASLFLLSMGINLLVHG
jgi:hypothetical protein